MTNLDTEFELTERLESHPAVPRSPLFLTPILERRNYHCSHHRRRYTMWCPKLFPAILHPGSEATEGIQEQDSPLEKLPCTGFTRPSSFLSISKRPIVAHNTEDDMSSGIQNLLQLYIQGFKLGNKPFHSDTLGHCLPLHPVSHEHDLIAYQGIVSEIFLACTKCVRFYNSTISPFRPHLLHC